MEKGGMINDQISTTDLVIGAGSLVISPVFSLRFLLFNFFVFLCSSVLLREIFDSIQYTNRPRSGLLAAIIDCPGDFALEIAAADNSVDIAVLQQELAGLKALGQFHAEGCFDRARSGKADEGLWFGEH